MNLFLPVESLPQIDFGYTQNQNANETARWFYINYSERSFTDLFDITNIKENQQSSS